VRLYTIKGKCLFTIQLLSDGNGTYRIPVFFFYYVHYIFGADTFVAVTIFLIEQKSGRIFNG